MTTAAEVFVVQLARASRKAKRLVRYLPRADRDDIIAASLLWCWEHRESYSLTTSLDTWFVNVVKNEYARWRRGELRNGAEMLDEIPTGDTTSVTAEALEAMDKLMTALTPTDKTIAQQLMLGRTRVEMMRDGLSHDQIYGARQRIKQLRRLIPDEREFQRVIRATPAQNSDEADGKLSAIDREIEELEVMPRHGADCPPCWKCKWFEGYLPGAHKRVGMPIQEPEVAAAVAANEARKQEIAKRVRAGTINRGE